jgi:hypothetical protein
LPFFAPIIIVAPDAVAWLVLACLRIFKPTKAAATSIGKQLKLTHSTPLTHVILQFAEKTIST